MRLCRRDVIAPQSTCCVGQRSRRQSALWVNRDRLHRRRTCNYVRYAAGSDRVAAPRWTVAMGQEETCPMLVAPVPSVHALPARGTPDAITEESPIITRRVTTVYSLPRGPVGLPYKRLMLGSITKPDHIDGRGQRAHSANHGEHAECQYSFGRPCHLIISLLSPPTILGRRRVLANKIERRASRHAGQDSPDEH